MIRFNFFFFGLLFFCPITQAQREYNTGLIFDPKSYSEIPALAPPSSRARDFITLPTSVSLTEFCPTAGDQGDQGSCVAWATTTARLISYAKSWGLKDKTMIDALRFSPSFVFNQARSVYDKNCKEGTSFPITLRLLKNDGVDQLCYYPYECNIQKPDSASLLRAKNYRIKDFAPLDATAYDPIFMIKRCLNAGMPMMIGMQTWASFTESCVGKEIWSGEQDIKRGGHAMVIVGYDDKVVAGGAVKVLNSWGTEWGKNGYIWIKYSDLKANTEEYFVLIDMPITPKPEMPSVVVSKPQPKPEPEKELEKYGGSLLLVTSELNNIGVVLDKEATRDFRIQGIAKKSTYKTAMPYRSGTQFRIYMESTHPSYVYLIGYGSATKEVDVIYPFNNFSAYFPFTSMVAIPDDNYYITLDENVGKDYLCILYSREEMDINALEKQIEASKKASFEERVRDALGNKVVPANEITFGENEVKFIAKSKSAVVPIIVEMEHIR